MKKIVVIHTSLAIRECVNDALRRAIPDCDIHNLIDERILQDVVDNDGVNASVIRRMSLYVAAAEAMGADVILNACSSVGGAFDIARQETRVPTVRIDEPMAEQAVQSGSRIAVYGTVKTTLGPSSELIWRTAQRLGREATVIPTLIDGAFDVLSKEKNVEKHNRMVLDAIIDTKDDCDVVVLAQASMSVLVPHLAGLGKPVLYSLESGAARVKEVLGA